MFPKFVLVVSAASADGLPDAARVAAREAAIAHAIANDIPGLSSVAPLGVVAVGFGVVAVGVGVAPLVYT